MMKLDEGRFSLAGDLNNPPASGDFRTTFSLEQPLFDKRIAAGIALAEKNEELSELTLARRRDEIAFRTISAFLDVQRSRLQLSVAEGGVKDAREHQRLASVRSEAGAGLKSDELRARTHRSEMEQQLITAGNDLQLAQLQLARITGLPFGERLDISEDFPSLPLARNQAELASIALASRSDLKEQGKAVEQAGLGLELARSAYWPTLYATAGYQMNDRDIPFGRDNSAWQVGATMRWELFDGRQRCHETDRARALQQAAEEQLAEQRQEAQMQVAETFLRREELGKRLEVARHGELAATEGVRILSRRYENSLALLVEVLDAQTALNRARSQVAELEAEYARATARLYFTTGTLLKEVAP
jgi:outer membrane protein TolC